jgi:hypothetical protein
MRKTLAILLLFLYLISASGIQIIVHYCGGKLKQISFFHTDEKKGCCGNKMKSKDCCKDKAAVLKINDIHKPVRDFKITSSSYQLAGWILPVPTLNFSSIITSADVFVDNPDPPNLNAQNIYLINGVFLI